MDREPFLEEARIIDRIQRRQGWQWLAIAVVLVIVGAVGLTLIFGPVEQGKQAATEAKTDVAKVEIKTKAVEVKARVTRAQLQQLLESYCDQRTIRCPRGEPGTVGPEGRLGARGPRGASGDAGPQGPRGFTGERGDKGDAGSSVMIEDVAGPLRSQLIEICGSDRCRGAQGEKGERGETGPQGPAGPPGPQGEPGQPTPPPASGTVLCYVAQPPPADGSPAPCVVP